MDIVDRLRRRPKPNENAPRWAHEVFEAADEIERLRKIEAAAKNLMERRLSWGDAFVELEELLK